MRAITIWSAPTLLEEGAIDAAVAEDLRHDLLATFEVEDVDMTRSLRAVRLAGRRIGTGALDVLVVAERHWSG